MSDSDEPTPHEINREARRLRAQRLREPQEDRWFFGALGDAEPEPAGPCAATCVACALDAAHRARRAEPRTKSRRDFNPFDARFRF